MDGRKALLRSLIVASLATTGGAANLVADDFIRPPAKHQSAPVRVGTTINQPAVQAPKLVPPAPVAPAPIAPAPVSETSVAPPATEHIELSTPASTVAIDPASPSAQSRTTRSNTQSVPAQVVSSRLTSSPLNWQPRGGRPSLSVDANRTIRENRAGSSDLSVDALGAEGVPQIPLATTAAPEVRLVVPARPEDAAMAEQMLQRRELAAKISNEIVGESKTNGGAPTNAIEPGPGWQAVGDELKQHVQKCEELLARRAYLSAMHEANEAIVRLVRVLDLKQNRFASEPTWAQAQQALREAQEFTSVNRIATDSELFARLIQSHETPILKDTNVTDLTPLAAAQHYRAYAEQCLVNASQGHPWFAELYYCLGRSLQAQAESNPSKADGLMHQSLTYFRAAHAIDPSNVTNANQLGYVLLKLDRPSEAINQLQQVVQSPNCPLESWQNLVQASSRLGDSQTEKWAVENYMAAKARGVVASGPVNTLVQVSEEQFRAMSPRTIGPSGALPISSSNMADSNMPMSGQGPMNMNNSGSVSPGQAGNAEPSGRTAILPRTGLFR